METTPLERAAPSYWDQGWNIIPLPAQSKGPPPIGATGYAGKPMTEEEVFDYENPDGLPMGNMGLVMARNVIGIDVDGAEGYATLRKLEKTLGPLPFLYVVTSHETLEEGFTGFFLVPAGLKWRGVAGPGIDIICWHNRCTVAPPSIHPKSLRTYRWATTTNIDLPFVPQADGWDELPKAWVKHCAKTDQNTTFRKGEDLLSLSEGTTCEYMKGILNNHLRILYKPGSRHEAMKNLTWAIAHESAKGHKGANAALNTYRKKWLARFGEAESSKRPLEGEWNSALNGARAAASAANHEEICNCKSIKRNTVRYNQRAAVTTLKAWR